MKLTLQTDYALRMLLYLAVAPEGLASVPEVAGAYGISPHHLNKVARALAREGFVESVRGRSGGWRLACEPAAIRLGDIVRRIEGELALVECLGEDDPGCAVAGHCGLAGALRSARRAFMAELDARTLADLVRRPAPLRQALRIAALPA